MRTRDRVRTACTKNQCPDYKHQNSVAEINKVWERKNIQKHVSVVHRLVKESRRNLYDSYAAVDLYSRRGHATGKELDRAVNDEDRSNRSRQHPPVRRFLR